MPRQRQQKVVVVGTAILVAGVCLSVLGIQYMEEREIRLRNETLRLENESRQTALQERQLELEAERLEEQRMVRLNAERREREEAERRARQEAEDKARAEQERIRRAREVEHQRITQERETLAEAYARKAGWQIMDGVGGGQDFYVQVAKWGFDEKSNVFEIGMIVHFNGAIVRGNKYVVGGILRVAEDGSNPRFTRIDANYNFKRLEGRLTWIGGAALVLEALSEQ